MKEKWLQFGLVGTEFSQSACASWKLAYVWWDIVPSGAQMKSRIDGNYHKTKFRRFQDVKEAFERAEVVPVVPPRTRWRHAAEYACLDVEIQILLLKLMITYNKLILMSNHRHLCLSLHVFNTFCNFPCSTQHTCSFIGFDELILIF